MYAERGVRNSHTLSNGSADDPLSRSRETNEYATISISSSYESISSPSSFSPAGSSLIEHRVSKMDTLAGIAIKYGVEVADIRRINNLVTDIQMFARKSLKIPLPGRHPPSPVMSNGSIQNGYFRGRPRDQSREIERSHNSLRPQPSPHRVSPAMSSLQGYYGLVAQSDRSIPLLPEGTEMAVFKSSGRKTLLFEDDNWHQKTQISGSSFSPENFSGDNSDGMNEAEGSIRRRQKHEILFSEGEGKGSAASSGNPAMGDGSAPVRKSSSASNLGEPESSALSIWPAAASKWTLMKPDVIAKPIFDGFQKPLAAWRNKAALD